MSKLDDIIVNSHKMLEGVSVYENDEIKQQLKALMLELIGEDDEDWGNERGWEHEYSWIDCNALRAEQRKKVEAL